VGEAVGDGASANDASHALAAAAHAILAAVAVGAAVACTGDLVHNRAGDVGDVGDVEGVGQILAFAGAPAARAGEPWCAHVRAAAAKAVNALARVRNATE
jgi:hypothetical protein